MKYKMTLDFIVDIGDNNGLALTVQDIADALNRSGYKTEFVKNVSESQHNALYIYGNNHKLNLKDADNNLFEFFKGELK
jgi:hypothetical protein